MADVIIFTDNCEFYNTNTNRHTRSSIRVLGPYRIATEVRNKGLTCQVVELMTEFSTSEIELICNKFIFKESLIVGFSTTFWYDNHPDLVKRITEIINFTRSINPKIKIVFGGVNGLNLVNLHPYDIDAVFLGYAEHYFIKYLSSLINKTALPFASQMLGKIKIYNFVEKSDVFQFCNSRVVYDKSDCLISGEPVIIEVGRGCVFKCKFCAYPLTGKKKLDHLKDPDVIRQELIHNYENFQIDKYIISDDTFNDSNEKLNYLNEIIRTLPFKIYFSAYLRLDLINAHKGQIELLEEMGLTGANFGVESFHEKAARTIGKGLTPDVSKKLLYDLKDKHWKSRVKIHTNLIVGLPYETLISYFETNRWISNNDECLVESVSVASLGLRNPKIIKDIWMSEFELNAEKYGYYWKEDPRFWYNDSQPVKNSNQAYSIKHWFDKTIEASNRIYQGGFSIFSGYSKRLFFKQTKTFNEQLAMDRHEFSNWIKKENSDDMYKNFIENYKERIFNL